LHASSGTSRDDDLRDRFRATLLGCAIGDALGFPFEGAAPEALARVPELAEDFRPRPRGRYARGQYTDDTQMTLALAASIAEEGKVDGRAVAQRFAQLWREGIILEASETTTEAIKRVIRGKPWMSSGAEVGNAENCAAVRAAPIGLWHFDRPSKVARDAEIQGVITHKDPRALAGAGAMAAGVALALEGTEPAPRRFCAAVGEAAASQSAEFAELLQELPRLLKWEVRSAVSTIARMGREAGEPGEWPGISSFVVPSVVLALYAFLREPNDFRACMRLALRAGGDVDSTCAMAGALSGAYLGMAGLPARLRRGVLHAEVIVEIADLLFARKFPAPRSHSVARARSVVKAR
jgi:ADP-ribosylglycohydrolase